MKDTNKSGIWLAIIGAILVLTLLGGTVFGVVNSFNKVSEDLNDIFGDLESDSSTDIGETPGDSSDSGETSGDGSDSGETSGDGSDSGETPGDSSDSGETPGDSSDEETAVSYSYENGDVDIRFANNGTYTKILFKLNVDKTKANYRYKVSWDIDANIITQVQNLSTIVDDNDNSKNYLWYYYNDETSGYYYNLSSYSNVFNGEVYICSGESAELSFATLELDYVLSAENAGSVRETIKQFVNSVEFKELGEVKTEYVFGNDSLFLPGSQTGTEEGGTYKSRAGVMCYALKPNTEYKASWSLKDGSDFGLENMYFTEDGVTKPCAVMISNLGDKDGKTLSATSTAEIFENTFTFTTDGNGFIAFLFYETHGMPSSDYFNENYLEALISCISSFKIVEV